MQALLIGMALMLARIWTEIRRATALVERDQQMSALVSIRNRNSCGFDSLNILIILWSSSGVVGVDKPLQWGQAPK